MVSSKMSGNLVYYSMYLLNYYIFHFPYPKSEKFSSSEKYV
jgi:hypothetical protein